MALSNLNSCIASNFFFGRKKYFIKIFAFEEWGGE
jgi:hypothetical protein